MFAAAELLFLFHCFLCRFDCKHVHSQQTGASRRFVRVEVEHFALQAVPFYIYISEQALLKHTGYEQCWLAPIGPDANPGGPDPLTF